MTRLDRRRGRRGVRRRLLDLGGPRVPRRAWRPTAACAVSRLSRGPGRGLCHSDRRDDGACRATDERPGLAQRAWSCRCRLVSGGLGRGQPDVRDRRPARPRHAYRFRRRPLSSSSSGGAGAAVPRPVRVDGQGRTPRTAAVSLAFLDAFIGDVSRDIVANGGEIHKYVGDEVIAIWRLAPGRNDAGIVRACFSPARDLRRAAGSTRERLRKAPNSRRAARRRGGGRRDRALQEGDCADRRPDEHRCAHSRRVPRTRLSDGLCRNPLCRSRKGAVG